MASRLTLNPLMEEEGGGGREGGTPSADVPPVPSALTSAPSGLPTPWGGLRGPHAAYAENVSLKAGRQTDSPAPSPSLTQSVSRTGVDASGLPLSGVKVGEGFI